MSRWFRLYDELLDDPKIQKLHPALFKVLINLWCVASRNNGRLPSTTDLSFSLRMTEDETFRAVSKLSEFGFIDADPDTGEQQPHGWEVRQYRSDVSTDRVRAHRERQKTAKNNDPPQGGDGNNNETFHETPPEQKQKQIIPLANANGLTPQNDPRKIMFDSGVALLKANGTPERQARSLLGRWSKNHGEGAVINAIGECQSGCKADPVSWITARLQERSNEQRTGGGEIRDPVLRALANSGLAFVDQPGNA